MGYYGKVVKTEPFGDTLRVWVDVQNGVEQELTRSYVDVPEGGDVAEALTLHIRETIVKDDAVEVTIEGI